MEKLFLGWGIISGVYGESMPIIAEYQTWTEYCKQRGWNPKEIKKGKIDETRMHRDKG